MGPLCRTDSSVYGRSTSTNGQSRERVVVPATHAWRRRSQDGRASHVSRPRRSVAAFSVERTAGRSRRADARGRICGLSLDTGCHVERDGDTVDLPMTVAIQEGPQYLCGEITVTSDANVDEDLIRQLQIKSRKDKTTRRTGIPTKRSGSSASRLSSLKQ